MSITIKSDGSVVCDNPQDAVAMMKLLNGAAKQVPAATTSTASQLALPTPAQAATDEDSASMLLHAGGMKVVRKPTLAVYQFLLANSTKAWDTATVADRLKMNRNNVNNLMSSLARKKIVIRVGFGQYKVK